jgi:hypothetical protein
MSVFRRPMFRGGPTNMNGIMSGIKDRQNYAYGERVKETYEGIQPVVSEILGGYSKPTGIEDPVNQFLISGGLDLMTRPSSGNILRDLAASGKEVTPELFKRLAQQRALKEEREFGTKSAALGMAGDIIGKEISASGKQNPLDLARFSSLYDKYTSQIGLPDFAAQNATNFELNNFSKLAQKVGSNRAGGVFEFNVNDKAVADQQRQFFKNNVGKVFYDPFEDNYKQIVVINDQYNFQEFKTIDEIDLITNNADKDTEVDVEDTEQYKYDPLNPIDNPMA